MLSFRNVSVQYGGVKALSMVTFDVEAHKVVSVIGPNGAGKSTLLNTISGLNRGNAKGEIFIAGNSMLGKSPVKIARAGVGRCFQSPPMIDPESVLENVMLGEHLRLGYWMSDQFWRRTRVKRLERDAARRAMSVLEFMGLSEFKDQRVGDLSYGTRKLIDIARSTVGGPKLLLLDEPTSGLDHEEQSTISRVLNELHLTTPMTILIVEHHMDVVRNVSDRVVGLDSGSVAVMGTSEEVLGSEVFQLLDSKKVSAFDNSDGDGLL
jgi:ABC-type branched-subunit amino acid transport system ATPase component